MYYRKEKIMNNSTLNFYNPVFYINDELQLATFIDELIKEFKQPLCYEDAFTLRARKALISAIMFYIYKECWNSDHNLISMVKLLHCANIRVGEQNFKAPLDIIFDDLKEKDPEHIVVREYEIFKQATSPSIVLMIVENISENLTILGWCIPVKAKVIYYNDIKQNSIIKHVEGIGIYQKQKDEDEWQIISATSKYRNEIYFGAKPSCLIKLSKEDGEWQGEEEFKELEV